MNVLHYTHVKGKLASKISATNFDSWHPDESIVYHRPSGNALDFIVLLNVLSEIITGCKIYFRISDKNDDHDDFDMLNTSYLSQYNTLQLELALLNIGKVLDDEDKESDEGVNYFEFYLMCEDAVFNEDSELYSEIKQIIDESSDDEVLVAILKHVQYLEETLFFE